MKKGDYFIAKKDGASFVGQVQVQNRRFFLCQNRLEGTSCSNKLGFKYSWELCEGTTKKGLAAYNITDFKVVTKARFTTLSKQFNPTALGNFLSWSVVKTGDEITFGCGSVKANVEQVRAFSRLLANKNFQLLSPILINVLKNIEIDTETTREVKELLKKIDGI